MKPEEFSAEYDRLCAAAQNIFQETNACDIHDGTCINGRDRDCRSFCCGGCEHLGPDGCKVQSLWCRTWTCISARNNMGDAGIQALQELKFQARRFTLYGRNSKEQTMEEFTRCGRIQKG